MKLSIFSLNLKGFTERNERKDKIIHTLKKKNADIIVLQEVHYDSEKYSSNSMEIINKELNYKYQKYEKSFNFSQDYGKGILSNDSIDEGLGILSKLPFSSSLIKLPIQKGIDRWPRIAIECNFSDFTLINLHYSCKGTKSTYPEREKTPKQDIIIGDFNMKPHELKQIQGDYISSYDFQSYVSYPSEGNTFDYCLLKKGQFKKLETFNDLSDHTGLYYEIEI